MNNPKKLNVIGPQLQQLRKWRRMTQSDLSTKLVSLGWKISRNGLAQMEITRKRITDCDLIFLAKALNVSITDFFPTLFLPQDLRSKIKSQRMIVRRVKPSTLCRSRAPVKTRLDFKEEWRRKY